jgi:hypothetical protein
MLSEGPSWSGEFGKELSLVDSRFPKVWQSRDDALYISFAECGPLHAVDEDLCTMLTTSRLLPISMSERGYT